MIKEMYFIFLIQYPLVVMILEAIKYPEIY